MKQRSQWNIAAISPFFFSFHFRGAGLRHVLPFGQKAILSHQPLWVPANLVQPANFDALFLQLILDFTEGGCEGFELSAQDVVLGVTLFQILQPSHDCFQLLRLLLGGNALSEAGFPLLRWHLVGRTTRLGLWLDPGLHGLEEELMHLLFQTLQRWIQNRNEDLKLCKVTEKVSNGLGNGPQLRAHPAEVLRNLIDAESEAEVQSLRKLIELLTACSRISTSLQPGGHRKTARSFGIDLWQTQWQRGQSKGRTHGSVPPPDMVALLLQSLVSKAGHPWRVRRRARWGHSRWHRFQRSRGCSEQRCSSQRWRPEQAPTVSKLVVRKIASCKLQLHWSDNRHRKKSSDLQVNPNRSPEKVKLKSRELKSELDDPNWVAQMAQNGNMKVHKRASVGRIEPPGLMEKGSIDRSDFQSEMPKGMQSIDVNWMANWQWNVNKKRIDCELQLQHGPDGGRRGSRSQGHEPVKNEWLSWRDPYNCMMRNVNESIRTKTMQIHWIETATSLRQRCCDLGRQENQQMAAGQKFKNLMSEYVT